MPPGQDAIADTLPTVKDYVSAASTIGQNHCELFRTFGDHSHREPKLTVYRCAFLIICVAGELNGKC